MLGYVFILIAVAARFMPHPLAFTPVAASLLFFGARGTRRQLWIPFVMLVASDVALTTLVYRYRLTWDQLVIWAWYIGMLWLGTTLKPTSAKQTAPAWRILGTAVAGSVSFFVISNFAVWLAWAMYPRTLNGLISCYEVALPFFRRSMEGDLLFASLMFATPVFLDAIAGWSRRVENRRSLA
jgi:hypothetical protein